MLDKKFYPKMLEWHLSDSHSGVSWECKQKTNKKGIYPTSWFNPYYSGLYQTLFYKCSFTLLCLILLHKIMEILDHMCNGDMILDELVVKQYKAAPVPVGCYWTISSLQDTRSRLECGALCSLRVDCLMFGYSSADHRLAHKPGLCAITSIIGPPVQTNYTFEWFTQK